MKSVTITRRESQSTRPGNYRVDFTIASGNNITPYLFVKQRVGLADGTYDDTFVTVASPSQIEEIQQQSPAAGEFFFRDNTISLISSDPTLIQTTANNILSDIQLTIQQSEDLDVLSAAETITVTNSSITYS